MGDSGERCYKCVSFNENKAQKSFEQFLAPTGAQGVTLSVRLSVCLSVRHKLVLGQRALREQSSSQRAIEQSEQKIQSHTVGA